MASTSTPGPLTLHEAIAYTLAALLPEDLVDEVAFADIVDATADYVAAALPVASS